MVCILCIVPHAECSNISSYDHALKVTTLSLPSWNVISIIFNKTASQGSNDILFWTSPANGLDWINCSRQVSPLRAAVNVQPSNDDCHNDCKSIYVIQTK